MKVQHPLKIALLCLVVLPFAQAGDGCDDPVSQWQPRSDLRLQLENQGWLVRSIRVKEHCYDVRALDMSGNNLHARFTPANFEIQWLEVKFIAGSFANEFYLTNDVSRFNSTNSGNHQDLERLFDAANQLTTNNQPLKGADHE